MAVHTPMSRRAHSAPDYPPRIQALANDPCRLAAALASALARLLGERPTVERTDVRGQFVFIFTKEPANRQFIAVGPGPELAGSIRARFNEIAEFNPQYFDVYTTSSGSVSPEDIAQLALDHNRHAPFDNKMQGMRIAVSRLANAWHHWPVLLRDTSDVSEYLRRTASFELAEQLLNVEVDQQTYQQLAWSTLRFSLRCLHHGRAFPLLRDSPPQIPQLHFNVNHDSDLRKAMAEVGVSSGTVRFDLTQRVILTRSDAKDFARSLVRHAPTLPGFVLSRQPPDWDFRSYARDLRLGYVQRPLVMQLSDLDLLKMLENGADKRFHENERLLISRLRSAADMSYEYQVKCESFDDCQNTIANWLPYAGLSQKQVDELNTSGSTVLRKNQLDSNRHLFNQDQISEAQEDGVVTVHWDEPLDNVCAFHGSDGVEHD